jgi:hypothetical protein
VINPDSPYSKDVSPDGVLDEVHSGSWYSWTWMKEIEEGMFLVPHIFFIDKTGIDNMCERFGLEPLKFTTTSLFKR